MDTFRNSFPPGVQGLGFPHAAGRIILSAEGVCLTEVPMSPYRSLAFRLSSLAAAALAAGSAALVPLAQPPAPTLKDPREVRRQWDEHDGLDDEL